MAGPWIGLVVQVTIRLTDDTDASFEEWNAVITTLRTSVLNFLLNFEGPNLHEKVFFNPDLVLILFFFILFFFRVARCERTRSLHHDTHNTRGQVHRWPMTWPAFEMTAMMLSRMRCECGRFWPQQPTDRDPWCEFQKLKNVFAAETGGRHRSR